MSNPATTAAGVLQLSLSVPGPGTLSAQAVTLTAGGARAGFRRTTGRLYGTARVIVKRAGRVRITIKPSGSMRALLRRTHHLRLKISVTFTPTGGTPHSEVAVRTVT
jgi:hypothetical protein